MVKLIPSIILLVSSTCAIAAAAPHTLTLHRQAKGSYKDMAASEGNRWAKKATSGVHTPAINDFFKYNIEVSIGHPPQASYPIFDTGSPYLWVSDQVYDVPKSASARSLNSSITLAYGAGNVTIDLYNDTISLGKDLIIKQELGVASNLTALQIQTEGVIGFAPEAMALAYTNQFSYIPTPMHNLIASHKIGKYLFAVDFRPLRNTTVNVANGQIDIGELDRSKYTGDVIYSPISKKSPFKYFWSTDVPKIKFGGKTMVSDLSAVLDTGSPLILATWKILQEIFSDIEGLGTDGRVMTVPKSQVHKLKDVTFELAGGSITYKTEQYLVPSFLEPDFGPTNGTQYTFFGVFGEFGLPLILGEPLMEHYYTIFDGVNKRVGFATRK
ncbi:hypothetical protein BGZ80_007468 [Entomortierella chlamydospora]|uniref:Peptidase A1 domain-containing protein n=1 Tax=Entomortierella chlamydospora TaxID=101097 RepID=A0A9P6MY41_9FUNG|nr:hypothetical protein BGZ79_008482 [Entomortierella chlamydospora]KAG0018195.1 hypothetical protein BGZ80_007468 [Entomortierella chlamydospora]